jgi:hypothetical protein
MSKIALSGAASGTATFTLAAPATSTNRTLTLPDQAGTIVTKSGTYVSASELGAGTANNTTFLRGDQTWVAVTNVVTRTLVGSGTYTPPAGVREFYVFVNGSTGGRTVNGVVAGQGGRGYSESKFTAPFTGAPYSYAVGAGGTNAGTAGSTTTFATISVTGSGGRTSGTGSAGGVGSGGQFNASGGAGGNGSVTFNAGGGGGGNGSRAGNGGNGATWVSGETGTGGGGTGGNNASGTTGGAAATTEAAGVITLPQAALQYISFTFSAGNSTASPNGGSGASSAFNMDTTFPVSSLGSATGGSGGQAGLAAAAGSSGVIQILEVY